MAAVRAIAPASAIALQRAASYLHERGEQLVLLDTSAEVLQTLAVLDSPSARSSRSADGRRPGELTPR